MCVRKGEGEREQGASPEEAIVGWGGGWDDQPK